MPAKKERKPGEKSGSDETRLRHNLRGLSGKAHRAQIRSVSQYKKRNPKRTVKRPTQKSLEIVSARHGTWQSEQDILKDKKAKALKEAKARKPPPQLHKKRGLPSKRKTSKGALPASTFQVKK
jgi:hypothetical protein